jgi:SAM-dependent methyltransferase
MDHADQHVAQRHRASVAAAYPPPRTLTPMHKSAYETMRRAINRFVPDDRPLTVVDLGSGTNRKKLNEGTTHAALFDGRDVKMIGVDVAQRANVDLVMPKPYKVPLRSGSVDVVVSGQVFEHIPFPWASMLEIARLLKPGGVFIVTVPSRGHPHGGVDCWRYYADGIRALAAWSGLKVLRAHTDFPVKREGTGRLYDLIDDIDAEGYWGDTLGVLVKPARYSRRVRLIRGPILWWANRAPFVSSKASNSDKRKRQRAAPASRLAR